MTEWQYARLIVLYQGERTEVSSSWLRRTEVEVHDWTVEWYAGEESSVNQHTGTDAMHMDILNTWGQAGWEAVTALHSEHRFEYLLKRAESGDAGDRVTAAEVAAIHDELTAIRAELQEINAHLQNT